MPNIKKYKAEPVEGFGDVEVVFSVDHEKFDPFSGEMCLFWMGGKEMVADHGAVVGALRYLASHLLKLVMQGYSESQCEMEMDTQEGFPSVEMMGLNVLSVSHPDCNPHDILFEEC